MPQTPNLAVTPTLNPEPNSVLRGVQDADVVHTEDRVDPVADLEIIHHELREKDIERMEKIAEGLSKVTRSKSRFLCAWRMAGSPSLARPTGRRQAGRRHPRMSVCEHALFLSCSGSSSANER